MSNEPYVSARFKVWAIFTTDSGEIRFDDVVACSASFAMNTIPTASLVVAVGKNAVTGELATIHTAQSKLKPRDKVVVKLQVIHGSGDDTKFTNGTYTIFDGFFIGIGYQRSENQANYVLHLTHWLDDLNNSSAINGNWFPSVPFDYAQTALYDQIGAVEAWSQNPTIAADFATPELAQEDLWEKVIKQLFVKLAGMSGSLVAESNKDAATNAAAVAALERMPGAGAAYYTPLALKLFAIGGENLADSFAKYFTSTIGTSFAQNTFWAKLITDYAAQFFFAISPAVKWALPIPFCAGLRWQADGGKLIKADEYNYANFSANMPQFIKSVELAFAVSEKDGLAVAGAADADADTPRSYYFPCGIYPWPPGRQPERGLRLFKMPPNWATGTDGSTITGLSSAMDARAAVDPNSGAGANLPPGVAAASTAADIVQNSIQLFAEHWYVTEVMQQRYGELLGPLRFDIAPGSIVKIATPARDVEFNRSPENPSEYVVASVVSVSYVINAERATAGTSFSIAHTKIAPELQANSIYSVAAPPLYKQAWFNGPLAVPE